MKLSPLSTKIAALLLISAKAVNGNCEAPPTLVGLGLGDIYCALYDTDPGQANLFETAVMSSLGIDPSGAFLGTCLNDLLVAALLADQKINRQVCEEGKTETVFFTAIESSSYPADSTKYFVPADGIVKNDISWDYSMCKSDSCDANVLQQVLTANWLDFIEYGNDGVSGYRENGWKATSTVSLTAECVHNQIGEAPVTNPELYCTADAPTCNNIKLAEITLADDAPFEVAICDDNDCLASAGAIDVVGYYAAGVLPQSYYPQEEYGEFIDPFCIADLEPSFMRRNQKYVSAKISEKAFDKTEYCTVKAASKRAGRCPCSDSATFEFEIEFSGKMEKCSWMTKNRKNYAARIQKYCADTEIKFQCAKTCSNCRGCDDDESHTFILPYNGKPVNCSYITKNINKTAIRQRKFCPAQGDACPKSCGYCPAS